VVRISVTKILAAEAGAGLHGSGSKPDWTIAYYPVERTEMMIRTLIRKGRSKGGLSGRMPSMRRRRGISCQRLAELNPEIAAGRRRLAHFAALASSGLRQEPRSGHSGWRNLPRLKQMPDDQPLAMPPTEPYW
jgi:hypothetical protein